MNALILAAGVSRRLYPLTKTTPKCLLDVGGKSIISYQLDALREQNITNVVIVIGYFREKIIQFLNKNYSDFNFEFIINHHFFETNTAYSLYLCNKYLKSNVPLILMNGDVVYSKPLLEQIIKSSHKNVLAVERKSCGREEVKVIEGKFKQIIAIGKELIQENALGEFIGVAKFSSEFSHVFSDSLDKLIIAGGKSDYFEAAIQPLLSNYKIYYTDVSDLPCIEIDFIEDLEEAQELVTSECFL